MWYLVVFIAALLATALLTPKNNVENARAAKLGDFQMPRTNYGDPCPLLLGTDRQKSPIIAWYGDFQPQAISKKMSTGMFSSKTIVTGYRNFMGIQCILALGPNIRLRKIWADTYEVWSGNSTGGTYDVDLPDLFGGDESGGGLSGSFTFYNGAYDQVQDPYLKKVCHPNVPAYNGLAHVVFKSFNIGNSTTPKSFSFEISNLTATLSAQYSIMPNGYDLNPMECAYYVLTNYNGLFGNSVTSIDVQSFLNCAKTLYEEELGMSLLVQSAVTGKDIMEEIMRVADGIMYQDPATGDIVARLIRKDYDVNTLLQLNESNITELKNFQKTTWSSTYNQARVTFKNRDSMYDEGVAVTQDFANINFQNRVISTDISVPGCKDATTASILAVRQLSMLNAPFYKCDIVVNRTAQALRPGDCFIFSWAPYGISNMVMRISKMDLGDATSNTIKISCVQDHFAAQDVVFADSEPTQWQPIDVSAKVITDCYATQLPLFFTYDTERDNYNDWANGSRLSMFAKAPSAASIAYDVYYRNAAPLDTPQLIQQNIPFSQSCILVDAYPSSAGGDIRYDTSNTLKISGLTVSAQMALKNYTTLDDAREGLSVIEIDSELMCYVGYTDNLDGTYTLHKVYRGLFDTKPESHAANTIVRFIIGQQNKLDNFYQYDHYIDLEFCNVTTNARASAGSGARRLVQPSRRAIIPACGAYLRVNGVRQPAAIVGNSSINLVWYARSRLDPQIRSYTEPDSPYGTEPGTLSRVRVYLNGELKETLTSGNPFMSVSIAGYNGLLELYLEGYNPTTGHISIQREYVSFNVWTAVGYGNNFGNNYGN